MYYTLLVIHSWMRWLVLLMLLTAVYRAWRGWLGNKSFTPFDNAVRQWTATVAHLQLALGLWLYAVSPMVNYFLHHFTQGVHQRQVRFFGMEHITMMVTAILLLTIGAVRAKRQQVDRTKFSTMAVWYAIALLLILVSVPWPFSPFANDSRPLFRFF